MTPKLRLATLSAGKVGHDSDVVLEKAWSITAYCCDVLFVECTGQV